MASCAKLLLVAAVSLAPACTVSFDPQGPLPPVCGDGLRGHSEVCDGMDLGGATCESLGHSPGALACAPDCQAFDVSGCGQSLCGNGLVDNGEACDGDDVGRATCESQGLGPGQVTCAADCSSLDLTGCSDPYCGDGVAQEEETCDDGNQVQWDGCGSSCEVTEIQVNPDGAGSQIRPSIAVSADGGFMAVAYVIESSPPSQNGDHVLLRLFDLNGQAYTGEIPATGQVELLEETSPDLAILPNGAVLVVFACRVDSSTDWDICLGSIDSSGASTIDQSVIINLEQSGIQSSPRIAMSATGESVVVWDHENLDGSHETRARRLDSYGDPEGPEILIPGPDTTQPVFPVVSVDDQSNFITAWESWESIDTVFASSVYASWTDSSNVPTAPTRLNTAFSPSEGNHRKPSAISFYQGAALVLWGFTPFAASNMVPAIRGLTLAMWDVPTTDALLYEPQEGSLVRRPTGVLNLDSGSDTVGWFFWWEDGADGGQIIGLSVDTMGELTGTAVYATSETGLPAAPPDMALFPPSGFALVWTAIQQDGDQSGVFLQRFSWQGDLLGTAPLQ